MEFEQAVRTRRTTKAFTSQRVDRATLDALFELARWAPNHRLTNPWRFRVLGEQALTRLKQAVAQQARADAPPAADGEVVAAAAVAKLDRAPTLVVCSTVVSEDVDQAREDRSATACAAYVVLLAAHDRGLAGYWRTPAILNTPAGREAVELPANEELIGLLHLGYCNQTQPVPERAPTTDFVSYLD